jgi:dimethylglycine dehydrogenase
MEKGYGGWGREYTQDYTAAEAGLMRLVRIDKPRFVGRQSVLEQLERPASRRLRLLAIYSTDPDPVGGEPVLLHGEAVARLTSAAYAYAFGVSLGFAYLPAAMDSATDDLEVELLGSKVPARILDAPLYDPAGTRIRG